MVMMMIMMMMTMMKIDVLASNDTNNGDEGPLLVSSPSESLLEVNFRGFLVALCLASEI
jgi:hypothetical protein